MQPGDVYVLNDPYHGGTHLPDVTVITPVYLDAARPTSPLFYVGSRGHHADIGGITPGSMPPFSTTHRGRGRADRQLHAGRARRACARPRCWRCCAAANTRRATRSRTWPTCKAQIAANEKGVQELRKMVEQFGLDVVQAYMRHVQDNAEESVRRVITRLKDGSSRCRWTTARRSRWRSASTRERAAP